MNSQETSLAILVVAIISMAIQSIWYFADRGSLYKDIENLENKNRLKSDKIQRLSYENKVLKEELEAKNLNN